MKIAHKRGTSIPRYMYIVVVYWHLHCLNFGTQNISGYFTRELKVGLNHDLKLSRGCSIKS